MSETITEEAQRLVMGDRDKSYGTPLEEFTRTAELWSALLRPKLKPGENITPDDIGRCMIAVKLARDIHSPKRDNRTDIAGYALCLDRIEQERNKRPD